MLKQHIFHARKTYFELSANKLHKGDFYLNFSSDSFEIEFIPKDKSIFSEFDLDESHCRLVFHLSEVTEIVYSENAKNIVSLNFKFSQLQSYQSFHFTEFAHVVVRHFLSFLQYKNVIIQSSNSSNRYTVNKIPKPKIQIDSEIDYISPKHLEFLKAHKEILKNLHINDLPNESDPLTLDDCMAFFSDNVICNHYENLKREIFRRGLTAEARVKIWPLLLGLFSPSRTMAQNNDFLKEKVEDYKKLRKQWDSIIDSQTSQIQEITELIRVVDNDVKRTDRALPQFQSDDHPNLVLLHNVLISYALYNKDTGYVQGMGDLVSPFIILYIKDWKDKDTAVLYDDTVVDRQTAESLMLWLLVGFMNTMQQDRMFTELAPHQQIAMESVHEIVTTVDEPIKNWLCNNDLKELFFLYRPFLLLFKREFNFDFVLRLWDAFFSHPKPYLFPRFFLAAVLMELFPRLMLHTKGGIGDVMSLTDKIISSINGITTLNLAIGLEETFHQKGKNAEGVLTQLPDKKQYRGYSSKFLNL